MSGSVTVIVVPSGKNHRLLECTDCGPLGTITAADVGPFVYSHLANDHGCNMDAVDITDLE